MSSNHIEQILGQPFDQVAIATDSRLVRDQCVLSYGGDWTFDTVTAEGEVFGKPAINVAELMFNYAMGPVELEILCYIEGDNWLAQGVIPDGGWALSHFGWHVENADDYSNKLLGAGFPICQEVRTIKHTNPYLLERGRTYRYVIHEARATLGFDIKLIERKE